LKKELLSKYLPSNNTNNINSNKHTNRQPEKLYHVKSTDFAHLNQKNKEEIFNNMINKLNEEDLDERNVDLLHPSRQIQKKLNDNESNTNSNKNSQNNNVSTNTSKFKVENTEYKPEIDLEFLNSLQSNPEEDISYEGYLIKLVDDKLKKLWFTLYDKYLYCKQIILLNILYSPRNNTQYYI
jgi:hypothetical protein